MAEGGNGHHGNKIRENCCHVGQTIRIFLCTQQTSMLYCDASRNFRAKLACESCGKQGEKCFPKALNLGQMTHVEVFNTLFFTTLFSIFNLFFPYLSNVY